MATGSTLGLPLLLLAGATPNEARQEAITAGRALRTEGKLTAAALGRLTTRASASPTDLPARRFILLPQSNTTDTESNPKANPAPRILTRVTASLNLRADAAAAELAASTTPSRTASPTASTSDTDDAMDSLSTTSTGSDSSRPNSAASPDSTRWQSTSRYTYTRKLGSMHVRPLGDLVEAPWPDAAAPPEVYLAFPGLGSDFAGMARDLLAFGPFAAALARCDTILAQLDPSLKVLERVRRGDSLAAAGAPALFSAIVAIEIALTDVLRAAGLRHAGVLGHSLGETACGYATGLLTRHEALLAALLQGRAAASAAAGAMAAVAASATTLAAACAVANGPPEEKMGPSSVALNPSVSLKSSVSLSSPTPPPSSTPPTSPVFLRSTPPVMSEANTTGRTRRALPLFPPGLAVVCDNGPDSATLAGPSAAIAEVISRLNAVGVLASQLGTADTACHWPAGFAAVQSVLQTALCDVLGDAPRPRPASWLGATSAAETAPLDAAYLARGLAEKVCFRAAVARLPAHAVVLEVGPSAILGPLLASGRASEAPSPMRLTSRSQPGLPLLAQSLGQLYALGALTTIPTQWLAVPRLADSVAQRVERKKSWAPRDSGVGSSSGTSSDDDTRSEDGGVADSERVRAC